jgi:hypothetical protein
LIEKAILNRAVLEEKELIIRNEYPRPTWEFTAHSVVSALDEHTAFVRSHETAS